MASAMAGAGRISAPRSDWHNWIWRCGLAEYDIRCCHSHSRTNGNDSAYLKRVADILPLNDVDHILDEILGVISDPL